MTYSDPEVLRASIAESAILVNGTSVGMAPNTETVRSSRIRRMFHKDLFVFRCDLQSAGDTAAARSKGGGLSSTGNGMYMLLYQGAASFKLWTGADMPVEVIKAKYFSGK